MLVLFSFSFIYLSVISCDYDLTVIEIIDQNFSDSN